MIYRFLLSRLNFGGIIKFIVKSIITSFPLCGMPIIYFFRFLCRIKKSFRGTWLAQLKQHVILDPKVVSSSSTVGMKCTLKKKKKKIFFTGIVRLPALGPLFHALILQAFSHLRIKTISITPKFQNAVIFVTFFKQVNEDIAFFSR